MRCTMALLVRLIGALVVAACVLQTALAFPYGKSSAVTELTPASLDKFVNTHKPVVILFYAPWCGHCKQFHPQFERFAELMKGTVRVGAIDADKYTHIGQQFGVRGFPTIKYWRSGAKLISSPEDYNGERTAAALQGLVVGDISSRDIVKVNSEEQIKQAVRNAPNKMVGVLFSAKAKVPPMLSVMSLSPKLKALPLAFAGSFSADKGLAAAFGVSQLPMLGVLRYTPEEGDSPEKFEMVPYAKNTIAYEPVAHFFLDCLENRCGANAGAGATSVNLDQEQQQKPATPPQSSVALPVAPMEYTPTVISQFCAPHTRKIRGQSPLCVFSLSEGVRLDLVYGSFQNDPLLFFETSQHRKELLQQLQTDFGVTLTPSGDAETSLAGSIVVLRHSKPETVRYALLEHIDSNGKFEEIMHRILSGEVHLITERVSAA